LFALIGKRAWRSSAAVAAASARVVPVLPRPFRRVVRYLESPALEELAIPRHLGSVLALVFLGSTLVYGTVVGGHGPAVVNDGTAALGFAIDNVTVEGNIQTSEIDILTTLGLDGATSVMAMNAADARNALLELPWVRDAQVRKVYPDGVTVEIKERQAFGIWQNGKDLFLIERNGNIITPMNDARFNMLPLFVGLGADSGAAGFDKMLSEHPDLQRRMRAAVRVAERRWDLYFRNGIVARLPERGTKEALATLAELDRTEEILSRDIAAVDLRLSDRIAIRLTPDALERRQAAWEERSKALKAMERRT
jgi:cell division protein FtsQ